MLALLRYKTNHVEFPENLNDLVPVFLKAIPQDPFGPGALVYRRQGDDFLLHSLGFDFKDNGGKYGRWREKGADDVFWTPEPVEEKPSSKTR